MQLTNQSRDSMKQDADQLADFIMLTQRSFLLDLSKDLNRGNVSYAQFFLLGYLATEDCLSMTDIARKMGHSTAAATGLVDRLERLKYVERVHAAEDRRKVMVRITDKGIELVKQLRAEIVDHVARMMAEMDKGEKSELLQRASRVAGPMKVEREA